MCLHPDWTQGHAQRLARAVRGFYRRPRLQPVRLPWQTHGDGGYTPAVRRGRWTGMVYKGKIELRRAMTGHKQLGLHTLWLFRTCLAVDNHQRGDRPQPRSKEPDRRIPTKSARDPGHVSQDHGDDRGAEESVDLSGALQCDLTVATRANHGRAGGAGRCPADHQRDCPDYHGWPVGRTPQLSTYCSHRSKCDRHVADCPTTRFRTPRTKRVYEQTRRECRFA